uniref:Uncharacterized protein n=1 Tax=Anopheles dirus TaxID=7168 RepID=A0A182NNG5_9DIPT
MSLPPDHKPVSNSHCYNDKSPPLYPSTDRFHPLGFSTPQQHGSSAAQTRNYYSVQPKHMLPRSRGFNGRYRYGQNDSQDQERGTRFPPQSYDDNGRQANTSNDFGNQKGFNRNWRGYHNRNQRHGGQRPQNNYRHKQNNSDSYNIADYFHPSMLEDPWEYWQRNNAAFSERTLKNDSPDGAEDDGEERSDSNE